MQAPPPTPQAPAPPAPPAPPAGLGELTTIQAPGRPFTARDIASIRARREELSNQLQSAEGRRERLSEALKNTEGADREGLEQRISLLDKRILQLEADIAETGRELTSAPAGLVGTTETGSTVPPFTYGALSPGQTTGIAIVFTLSVLMPLAIATARRIWRRAVPLSTPRELKEIAARLEHLSQAVDTVAIEVERVSEGQRFVTRILSDAHAPAALGAGQGAAEPIRVPDRDAVPVRRAEP